jgi:uncharacterized repeat protein (TIGR03803 family)
MIRHPGSRPAPAVALLLVSCVLALGTSADAQSLETLVHFNCATTGCAPNGPLLQASDGRIYGTTSEDDVGPGGDGTVFRLDRDGSLEVLLSPARSFFEASDGFFYGTADDGGTYLAGSVFRMDSAGTVTDLYSFDGTTAASPSHLLAVGRGLFYGLVSIPGTDDQRLFVMRADRPSKLLLPSGDPVRSVRAFIASSHGALYGTTYEGVVFRMSRKGQTRVLHTFPTVYVDLMEARDGFFYGVTIDGGTAGAGTIFRMNRAGQVRVLHSFDGAAGGASPYEAPIQGRDGYLYGTTGGGGAFGLGTVYRMHSSGAVTILHSFGESADAGANPVGDMVLGDDGALYGTTVRGGLWDQGTLFRLELPD